MEIFNQIISLCNEINSIYFKLLKLEFENKKCDIDFLELIFSLKNKLKKEKELFEKFVNDCDRNYDKIYNVINTSVSSYDENIRKRILDYAIAYECFDVSSDDDLEEEEIIEKNIMFKLDQIYISCCRNIYLIYHSFLQEYIDIGIQEYMGSKIYDCLREDILGFKYYNAFVNHDMESQLVSNNFDVPIINYVDVYFIAESLRVKGYEEIILDSYADKIFTSIVEILSIKDNEYDDKLAFIVNNQCMLRAGLSLLSESDYSKLQSEISSKINELTGYDNIRSVNAVNDVVNRRKKDKERIRKISMKPLDT